MNIKTIGVVGSLMVGSFVGGIMVCRKIIVNTLTQELNSSSTKYKIDMPIFGTRSDAIEVLSQLTDLFDQYKFVSVADLNDLIGHNGTLGDSQWVWTDLGRCRIVRNRQGYILDIGVPHLLKDEDKNQTEGYK